MYIGRGIYVYWPNVSPILFDVHIFPGFFWRLTDRQ